MKPKLAIWKGYAVKHKKSGEFVRICHFTPELSPSKEMLKVQITPVEEVVKVELREVGSKRR